ncbi:MAG: ribonuclease P protein component [Lentisphaeria bacterium]|nr:ribonuclease P protein component [Lentisphaeria bacterium]
MKRTLCKTDKIRFKSEFDQIRQNGTKLVGSKMLAVYAPAPDDRLRCGVICGKKYSLLAVKRNRARRLLWESFRLLRGRMEVRHLLLIPRRQMENAVRQQVTRELAGLLAKAGLLPQEVADSPPEC